MQTKSQIQSSAHAEAKQKQMCSLYFGLKKDRINIIFVGFFKTYLPDLQW